VSKLDRLLLILNLLRSRRNLKASTLAKECEVSERTIFRDIQALSQARVPVYFEDGYKLLTDAFLPPLNLTIDELLTIYLGLSSEPVQSIECLRKLAKQALVKLESSIPVKTKADYEKARKQVTVRQEKKVSPPGMAVLFELLKQAISSEKKIKLDYVCEHVCDIVEVVPKSLLYKNGEWYLIGLIEKKTRYLRMDRIRNVTLS
jgi:predicted DNA-binding transcriptional regulator YafY